MGFNLGDALKIGGSTLVGGPLLGPLLGSSQAGSISADNQNQDNINQFNSAQQAESAAGQAKGQSVLNEIYGSDLSDRIPGMVNQQIDKTQEQLSGQSAEAERLKRFGADSTNAARSRASQQGRQLSAGEESQIMRSAQLEGLNAEQKYRTSALAQNQSLLNSIISQQVSVPFAYEQMYRASVPTPFAAQTGGVLGGLESLIKGI